MTARPVQVPRWVPLGRRDSQPPGRRGQPLERLVAVRAGRSAAVPLGRSLPPLRALRAGFRYGARPWPQRAPLLDRVEPDRAAPGALGSGGAATLPGRGPGAARARHRADRHAASFHQSGVAHRGRRLAAQRHRRALRRLRRTGGGAARRRGALLDLDQRADGVCQARLRHRRLAARRARLVAAGARGDAQHGPGARRRSQHPASAPRRRDGGLCPQRAADHGLQSAAAARPRSPRSCAIWL